jgi:hypothetical protein
MTKVVVNASTIVTVELIDEITVIAGPILALTIGIDMITTATTAVMTATISATTIEVIVVMIAMMIVTTTDETTDMMIDVSRMTTVTTTTTGRSRLRRHPKGATPFEHFRRLTVRSTSSSVDAKRFKATAGLDQTPGRSGTSTLKTRDLCDGLNSQSLSPRKIIGFTSLTPGPTR